MAARGWGSDGAELNSWRRGPHSCGSSQVTWPGLPLSFPLCYARLSSETCGSHLLCKPPLAMLPCPLHPCTWDLSQHWVQNRLCLIIEGLATPTPVPQTLTHNIQPEPQKSQLRVGSKPIPGQLLPVGLRLSLGLCRLSSTIRLFPAFLVSSSEAWMVPLCLMGLLPTFQIALMLSPLC